jgi:hypothetical protein
LFSRPISTASVEQILIAKKPLGPKSAVRRSGLAS